MRGFWFTMEAAIAGIILVSFIGFLSLTSFSAETQDPSLDAYALLHDLNNQGLLKIPASENNATTINNLVTHAYSHRIQICTATNCTGTRPSADNVWVGTYIISGNSKYAPREVRLYLYE